MKALEKIILYRNYKQAEKTHRRLTKAGYYSIAETIADFMCDIENKWISNDLDLQELIYDDPYELIAEELNSLPVSTYNDFVTYYNGGIN